MTRRRQESYRGVVLDRRTTFTMSEFCLACGADRLFVLELVEEGVIDPRSGQGDWRFDGEALVRARRAHRLVRDLGINMPGVALALDLLDELEHVHRHAGDRES